MTTLVSAARVFRVAFFLASAALISACKTGADDQGAASGNVETKAALTADKATPASAAAPAAPGQAQPDISAALLAKANAHLKDMANGKASVEANAQPGNPSLKVGTPSALVDAKVQAGNPSLSIGGLKAAADTSASTSTPADTSKTGANAGAKAKVGLSIGQ